MNEIQRLFDWALSEKPTYEDFNTKSRQRLSNAQRNVLCDGGHYILHHALACPYEAGLRDTYRDYLPAWRDLSLAMWRGVEAMQEKVPGGPRQAQS